MTGLRRAFVAVVPAPSVLDAVDSLVDSLADSADSPPDSSGESSGESLARLGLRWTRRHQRHLTLQFLGSVPERQMGSVPDGESLAESLGDSLRRCARPTLQLGGGGAFPSARRGSVLWLGLVAGAAELGGLAAAVREATSRSGVDPGDDRPFRPHLTVARRRPPTDLAEAVAALGRGPVGEPWSVDHVVLMDSDTRPDGAVYTEVARLPLGGA